MIPSPSTILRNRLMLHLGFCQYMCDVILAELDAPGGMVRWSTLDLSPRIGIDF